MKKFEIVKNLNPFNLPSTPLIECQNLPKISGIYFVLESEEILYIGKSQNLRTRWTGHHRWNQLNNREVENISIAWLKVNTLELLPEMERIFIKRFNPLLNFTKVEAVKPISRIYVSGLGKYFDDILVIEAALRGISKPVMAGELIMEAIDTNQAVRNGMIEYLAKKRNIAFSEMRQELLGD